MILRIDHKNGTPLHLQVESLFRELIEKPNHQNGELLPKETDIANQLGISRNTVRQAIGKLVMEGLLERKKGVGTKVATKNINTQLNSWMSFTQEMNSKGIAFVNYEIKVEKVKATVEVASALEIKEGVELVKLSRLRGDKEGPFVQFVSWLHPRIRIKTDEDFTRPLYDIIEKDYSIYVDLSSENIKAVLPTKEIAEKLQISESDPILKRIRKVYDPGKRPIEYSIGYYRSDKFSYAIDIKREHN